MPSFLQEGVETRGDECNPVGWILSPVEVPCNYFWTTFIIHTFPKMKNYREVNNMWKQYFDTNYSISDVGEVRNDKTNKLLS